MGLPSRGPCIERYVCSYIYIYLRMCVGVGRDGVPTGAKFALHHTAVTRPLPHIIHKGPCHIYLWDPDFWTYPAFQDLFLQVLGS